MSQFHNKMIFTKEERVQIIKWYYSGSTAQEVVGRFIFSFENRPVPTVQTVLNIVHKFERTACAADCKECSNMSREPRIRVINEVNEQRDINVCSAVEHNQPCSSVQIAEQVGIPDRTVRRILKKHGYRSYKIQRHQEILPDDEIRRVDFCENIMEKIAETDNFIENILFTDESTFSLRGRHNSMSTRYWSRENQHLFQSHRTQYPQKLNVWAGILGGHVIGPIFIDGTLTAVKYLQLLQTEVVPAIRALNVNFNDIWFQQDNCPAHTARIVRQYLHQTFPNRIITSGGTIAWPPRSPDLAPLDFFLWGYIHQQIHTYDHQRPNNLDELRQKLIDSANSVTPEMLSNVRNEFYYRICHCQELRGGIFEHLLH